MANQMPGGVQARQKRCLRFPLLRAALSKMTHARRISFLYLLGGGGLGDGDEGDVLGAASCASGGSFDALAHHRDVPSNDPWLLWHGGILTDSCPHSSPGRL